MARPLLLPLLLLGSCCHGPAVQLLPPTAIFRASGGPGAAGCFRSPTLLQTDSKLLALAAHHWDSHESPCNDVGLKVIVVRSSVDGITCVDRAAHRAGSNPHSCLLPPVALTDREHIHTAQVEPPDHRR